MSNVARVDSLEKEWQAFHWWMSGERDAPRAKRPMDWPDFARSLAVELDAAQARVAELQARVDALMIEFCPIEITPKQWENYKKYQRRVSAEDERRIDAALSEQAPVSDEFALPPHWILPEPPDDTNPQPGMVLVPSLFLAELLAEESLSFDKRQRIKAMLAREGK